MVYHESSRLRVNVFVLHRKCERSNKMLRKSTLLRSVFVHSKTNARSSPFPLSLLSYPLSDTLSIRSTDRLTNPIRLFCRRPICRIRLRLRKMLHRRGGDDSIGIRRRDIPSMQEPRILEALDRS